MKKTNCLLKFPGPLTNLRALLNLLNLLKVRISNLVSKTKHSQKQPQLLLSNSKIVKKFNSKTLARKRLPQNRTASSSFKNQAWKRLFPNRQKDLGFNNQARKKLYQNIQTDLSYKNQVWTHQWPKNQSKSPMHSCFSNQPIVFNLYQNKTKIFSLLTP